MNATALAVLGLAVTAGQPAADYFPIKSRTLKLDIEYKPEQRNSIQQVQLVVSRDQGQTWQVADAVTRDKDHFVFNAEADGLYWLNMVIVFQNGKKDPPDVTRVPPAQKLLVDATPPVVRIASAKREGEEVVVEWTVDEKHPADAPAQVQFKPSGPLPIGDWQAIPAAQVGKRSARFKPGTDGPVAVQVTAQDLAGNAGSAAQEVPAVVQAGVGAVAKPPADPPVVPDGGGNYPAPNLTGPIQPVMPTKPAPQDPSPAPAVAPPREPAPLPVQDTGPRPIAEVGPGIASPAPPPAAPAPSAQFINFLRFDLQYQLESGPSGISRIDLYVTRDDGRTWERWSQHDGRESPLKVLLDARYRQPSQQLEGDYGFRLVPVSGAGLTDGAPAPGSAPEMRVHVDVTPPMIKVFQPVADPANRNVLTLRWEATDRNFGRDPILIEYSEAPGGPWKPVTAPEPVTPVLAGPGQQGALRIPNTGSYAWQLPAGMATHKVYLKFTAWDAAGNRSEVATPSPVMVDLTTPRARIQGILPGGVTPRP
jgi:hypothetical protein